MAVDFVDLARHVETELQKLPDRWGGNKKGNRFWIRCPFHAGGNENTPSFAIDLTRRVTDKGFFIPGTAKCWGCNKFCANWNITAEALGLQKYGENDNVEQTHSIIDKSSEKYLLDKYKIVKKSNKPNIKKETLPWNIEHDWRGIGGKLMVRVQARTVINEFGNKMVYLPTYVNKNHVGGIKARYKKVEGKLSYINTKGEWTKTVGLYPYDYTKAFLKKKKLKTVMLVEGPRDALASLQYGIPTFAILGSANWSDIKAELILATNPSRIILGFDPDQAGRKVTKQVFNDLKEEVAWMKIYRFAKNVDPGNMGKEVAEKIIKYMV